MGILGASVLGAVGQQGASTEYFVVFLRYQKLNPVGRTSNKRPVLNSIPAVIKNEPYISVYDNDDIIARASKR